MAVSPLGVLVPDRVAHNMIRERAVDRQMALWDTYDRLAKDLDHRLSLVWVRDDVDPDSIYGGMVPGRWHWHRDNSESGVPDTYEPLLAEDGGFREPGSGDIERLRSSDLWNPDVARRYRTARARAQEEKDRESARKREGRRGEGRLALKALESPGVLFSRDVRFSHRTAGRRGRARHRDS